MKRIHALIILISLIVTIVILIGYVVGNIRHKIENTAPEDISSILSEDNIPFASEQSTFALQLFASNSYRKVNKLKEDLLKYGQKTKITKLKRDGEIVYRLRVEELLPEDEAIALGEELKREFSQIDGYWLEEQAIMVTEQKHQTEFDQLGNLEQETNESTVTEQKEDVEIKEVITEPTVSNENVKQIHEREKKYLESSPDDELYEIQLLASSNFRSITDKRKILEKAGFPTKIYKVIINGKTIYRLRLKQHFTKEEAIEAGKKLTAETEFKNYWLQDLKGNEIHPQEESKTLPTYEGKYDIQILANTSRKFVEEKLAELEKNNFQGKIVTAQVKGKTYYRLRLLESYDKDMANKVAEALKKKVKFVNDYWIVKSDDSPVVKATKPKKTKKKINNTKEQKKSDILVSLDPRYAPRKILYTVTCPKNKVDIRTGPGVQYKLDPIGKLMKDVELYVVEERNGWLRFRLMKDSFDWSGWVRESDLK